MKKKILLETLDISLINNENDNQTSTNESSPMGTTYRAEGFSIGRDYMRFMGTTLSSSLSPKDIELEEIVGRGTCSIVKRARHKSTSEPYALKIFPIRHDETRREMLLKELKAMCTLNYESDCLINLLGAFYDKEDGTVALVLEYMDRGSLEDFLHMNKKSILKKIPEITLASIAYQILWGLAFLHHEKISHRDIKPANILINSAGQIKLSDFGIASKRMDGEQQMNHTVVGTTRYMSPERLKAKPYTCLSDMWSFGLLLLECATGYSPFHTITSIVELVQTIDDLSLDELVPNTIKKQTREVIIACLQKIPDKRIPASILISSPWFSSCGIHNISDSRLSVRKYIEKSMPQQKPEYLSFITIAALKESSLGLVIYKENIK